MKRRSLEHLDCSMARALDVVGEWWTLMIVRDVFLGMRRFDVICDDLGISRNILTDRLQTLIAHDVLEKRPTEDGHHEYHLTAKGMGLSDVVLALWRWGEEWESGPEGPTLRLEHACGHEPRSHLVCRECGDPATVDTTRIRRNRRRID
ncbi:MAG: hypothetical protein RI958_793 [Actinomycetota bacterium]